MSEDKPVMNALPQAVSQMSPDEKRALLARLLREKARKTSNTPLSFAQQRLWFWDQLQPHSALYNMPAPLRLRGNLNVEALEKALNQVIDRHEAIRTRFLSVNDSPTQVIDPSASLRLEVTDLSGQADQEKVLQSALESDVRKPFDLSRDLLLRARLYRLGPLEHVLSICIHHIASDAVSLGILFNQMGHCYQAYSSGRAPTLPPLSFQYSDYALWQRQWLQGEVLEKQVNYWRQKLGGDLPRLELPTDFHRPALSNHLGSALHFSFGSEVSEALKNLSRREGVTLFMTLLAAFKAFLYRYTEQNDFAVGSPIAGRNRAETEDLIGFFVNTLVLRTPLKGEMSFKEFLKLVRETCLQAMANQDVPFEKLVEELKPERSASSTPFIQVIFGLQNAPMDPENLPSLDIHTVDVHTGTSKFDLTVLVKEAPDGLRATVEFKGELFRPETIERMFSHFGTLLKSIGRNPEETIGRLRLMEPEETRQLLETWNQTDRPYPRELSVSSIFEERAAATPDALAVEFGQTRLSYRQLNERGNQLAALLKRRGVGRGDLVGTYLDRDAEMVVALLAILKTGAAYLPIDLNYPRERTAMMIEDAAVRMMITRGSLREGLPEFKGEVIDLDSLPGGAPSEDSSNPSPISNGNDPAYVIYTSGSTGKPKGSVIPHRGISRLVLNTDYVQIEPSDRFGQVSNVSFDAATFEIWGALLNGASVAILSKDLLLSPVDFLRELEQQKISIIFLTTALFNQFSTLNPTAFGGLKYLLFGGEACDPNAVRKVLQQARPAHLLHVYGPTETTTFATWEEVKEVREAAQTVPIGRPIANTRLYILDRERQPVPVGVAGELLIAGDGLALEYLRRPELTAEKFVTIPALPQEKKLYRTGDRVRYLEDGRVEFIGRGDQQVKIRGFRIELGEIEVALNEHQMVRESCVNVFTNNQGDKQLAAYLVTVPGSVFLPTELNRHLKSKLPDFMVPAYFVELPSLPLNPNGKVDRQALPLPHLNGELRSGELVAPRDPWEEKLTEIWQSVLDRRQIGVTQNFFDLGGHSLMGVRLFMQIEKVFGFKLPVGTLFQAPTVEKLARVIRDGKERRADASLIEIQPHGFKPPIFWLHTLGGGGGGGLFTYRKLAEYLGPDQPSYGLVAPPKPFAEMRDMARHYISEIKTIQIEGPYYLGGYCFGGVIAFEMAQQLAAQGEEVAFVGLLESVPPNVIARKKLSSKSLPLLMDNVGRTAREFWSHPPAERYQRLKRKAGAIKRKLTHLLGGKNGEGMQPALDEVIDMSHYPKDYKEIARVHWQALHDYQPQPGTLPLHLFRTRKHHLFNLDPTLGWGSLVPHVQITYIPGAHESMLDDPHVSTLAAELSRVLEKIQRPKPADRK